MYLLDVDVVITDASLVTVLLINIDLVCSGVLALLDLPSDAAHLDLSIILFFLALE